jgi:hypothetical protein
LTLNLGFFNLPFLFIINPNLLTSILILMTTITSAEKELEEF